MKIVDWKKHTMKIGNDPAMLAHCPSCGTSVIWDNSWDEKKLIFYCSECGKYSYKGHPISDEEAERLSKTGD